MNQLEKDSKEIEGLKVRPLMRPRAMRPCAICEGRRGFGQVRPALLK